MRPDRQTGRYGRLALWCASIGLGALIALSFNSAAEVPTKVQRDAAPEGDGARRRMPDAGQTYSGKLPELTKEQASLADELKADVTKIADEVGARSLNDYPKLVATAKWLDETLTKLGYKVERQAYTVRGREVANLSVALAGAKRPDEIVIVGAHYDSVPQSPAADDNGSGVASLLALARRFAGKPQRRTLRFVAFVNEEPPYFQEPEMGSLHYAEECKQRHDNIVAMLSLETLGYYSDAEKSQRYPPPMGLLYPSTGNFVGFAANRESEELVRKAVASFRKHEKFPSEWGSLPGDWPGVGWSDHWSFWRQGYPAIMVTDTALYRNPNYHKPSDKPDTLDYGRLARVVEGLQHVVEDLAGDQ